MAKVGSQVAANPENVILKSAADHPMNISYNGGTIVLPPYGNTKTINKKLLGAIPKNVFVVAVK